MNVKSVIFSLFICCCVFSSWISYSMQSRMPAVPKVCIPALLALRDAPERCNTPVSTMQRTWLSTLVIGALNQKNKIVDLEFGQWLADTLKQVHTNPERQKKLANFLQAAVQTVTAKKTVAGVSVKMHSVDDALVIEPMMRVLIYQADSQDQYSLERVAIDYDPEDSPDVIIAQPPYKMVTSQES